MKIKWTGEQPEITIRGITFTKGKAETVSDPDTAEKVLGIEGFAVVKSRAKNGNKG